MIVMAVITVFSIPGNSHIRSWKAAMEFIMGIPQANACIGIALSETRAFCNALNVACEAMPIWEMRAGMLRVLILA